MTGARARQRYPWNGLVDVDFTLEGDAALPANSFVRTGHTFAGWATNETGSVVYFDNQSVSNLASTEGDVFTLYAVWILPGSVQLWEGGPYWATMNIGAENPEDDGLYFWWGDTVGYRREGVSLSLYFRSGYHDADFDDLRLYGFAVRPVQGFAQ